jgi:RecG-like helicase
MAVSAHCMPDFVPFLSASNLLEKSSFLTPKEISALSAAGLKTYHDLLMHLPKRHEDRRQFDAFPIMPTDFHDFINKTAEMWKIDLGWEWEDGLF